MSIDEERGNKGLVIILIVLFLVIIGLTAGIVVLRLNNGNDDGTSSMTEAEYYGEPVISEEQDKQIKDYQETYDKVIKEARERIVGDAVAEETILEVYSPTIDGYLADGDYSDAQTFILLRHEALVQYGYKKKAMDLLISMDYSIIPEHIQNRYYKRIVALATELGESETVSKYQALVDETAEAAREAGEASKAFTEKMMNETGPMLKHKEGE